MTFNANLLLRVRLSKISLFCTKVGKGLCGSLLAEADLNEFKAGTTAKGRFISGQYFD